MINRPYSIIIGRCCGTPIICVCGDIGVNSSDECKGYAVVRPLNLKTSLVICIISPRKTNLAK
jgi:hypothetical protein